MIKGHDERFTIFIMDEIVEWLPNFGMVLQNLDECIWVWMNLSFTFNKVHQSIEDFFSYYSNEMKLRNIDFLHLDFCRGI